MTLWDFSLDFYTDLQVQEACLTAQDDHGADVNILLFLLWRARSGDALGAEVVTVVDAAVAPWRDATVVPLRRLRRTLKTSALLPEPDRQESFRSRLKKLELEAERLEQDLLGNIATTSQQSAPTRDAAAMSLSAYAEHLGTRFPEPLVTVFLERLDRIDPAP